tara:strand:- start:461 stop:1066 length:606 start_codon:yes stop_codon:yes gene_type:complete
MKKIILIGAGGHCNSCIDVIELEKKYKVVGLVDKKINTYNQKYKILGNDKNLKIYLSKTNFAHITLGQIKNLNRRGELFNNLKKIGYKFPSIVSPLAYVSPQAKIGEGTIVMHGAIVNRGAIVGNNTIINTKALVEHDAIVGNNCHLATGSTLNGGALIGNNSFIGSHTVLQQNIKVGNNCFVNANLFINKNLKNNSKIYE